AYASPVLAIAALCLCAIGFLAVQPIFWTFPAQILSGKALAAGIGFFSTMGGFFCFFVPVYFSTELPCHHYFKCASFLLNNSK
ncbi:hypothetical protein BFI42_14930, partial [Yersinia pestis subsp. microtus bv. Altaica]